MCIMRFQIETTHPLSFLVPICYRWHSSMRTKILLSPRNMDQETLHFIWPVDMDTLWVWEKLYRDTPYKLCLNFLRRPEKGKWKKERNGAQNYNASQILSLGKLHMFAYAVWHFFGVRFIWRVSFLYIIFCWSSLVSFLGICFCDSL